MLGLTNHHRTQSRSKRRHGCWPQGHGACFCVMQFSEWWCEKVAKHQATEVFKCLDDCLSGTLSCSFFGNYILWTVRTAALTWGHSGSTAQVKKSPLNVHLCIMSSTEQEIVAEVNCAINIVHSKHPQATHKPSGSVENFASMTLALGLSVYVFYQKPRTKISWLTLRNLKHHLYVRPLIVINVKN